jgi:hypothetical protein
LGFDLFFQKGPFAGNAVLAGIQLHQLHQHQLRVVNLFLHQLHQQQHQQLYQQLYQQL